jgi:hypothetical protein
MADDEHQMIGVLWWRQRQSVLQLQLTLHRAALCAAQMMSSVAPPPSGLFFSDPRATPTRVPRIDLTALTDDDCLLRFRFTLPEIERIAAAMRLPSTMEVNKVKFTRAFGLAMLLRKLVWPARNVDLATEFGLDYSTAGRIVAVMFTEVEGMYSHHLELWPGLTPARIASYAAAITACTPQVIDVWGFVDGSSRRIARPVVNERHSYSGYKRGHLQNYQGVVTPDGLVVSCMGPFVGSKNDLNMLHESGLEALLDPLVHQQSRTLMLYADLIYKGQRLVMVGYPAPRDEEEKAYNTFMSSLRVHVETAFGKVTQLFAGTDLKRTQRTGLSATASQYLCCVLFTNIHTCMHPGEVNVPWDIDPPTVEEYLA